jgi:phosphoenolpyruvate carboxylase
MALGWSAMALGLGASAVIGLRTAKLAKGGRAAKLEAQRMVAEKVRAALELQAMAMTGALGANPTSVAAKTVRHYAPKVRANLRRLSKS